jgi:pimeloyl-ACP methyl ester carboxylesterase
LLAAVIVYAIASMILAVALGELAFHPERAPVDKGESAQATAARFGAVLYDASIAAPDGVRLQAWFARPAKANGDAVILLHGVADNRQGMMGFAELFLSHGYTVLLPDSRAHGMSGGNIPTYGLKEAGDVRAWFDWLENSERPRCVFGMGESMGAAVVLQAVKTTPFCAVVAESGFASFRQIAYIRLGQIFHAGEWLGQYALRPTVELAFLYGKLTRGVDLAAASPEQSVVGSRVPILLIHGLNGDNIPAHQSEMIRAHNPADITLWEIPKAGHCGAVSVAPEKFNSRVLEWFTTHSRSALPTTKPGISRAAPNN